MDPWHALGIVNKSDPFFNSCGPNAGNECAAQRVRSPSSSIVTIDGTAHCRDMYRPNLFASAEFCGNSSSGATVDSDSEPSPVCANDTASIMWAHSVIEANVLGYLRSGGPAGQ